MSIDEPAARQDARAGGATVVCRPRPSLAELVRGEQLLARERVDERRLADARRAEQHERAAGAHDRRPPRRVLRPCGPRRRARARRTRSTRPRPRPPRDRGGGRPSSARSRGRRRCPRPSRGSARAGAGCRSSFSEVVSSTVSTFAASTCSFAASHGVLREMRVRRGSTAWIVPAPSSGRGASATQSPTTGRSASEPGRRGAGGRRRRRGARPASASTSYWPRCCTATRPGTSPAARCGSKSVVSCSVHPSESSMFVTSGSPCASWGGSAARGAAMRLRERRIPSTDVSEPRGLSEGGNRLHRATSFVVGNGTRTSMPQRRGSRQRVSPPARRRARRRARDGGTRSRAPAAGRAARAARTAPPPASPRARGGPARRRSGVGRIVGRCTARPSAFVNSAFRTGFGEVRLATPARSLSSACT